MMLQRQQHDERPYEREKEEEVVRMRESAHNG